MNEKSSDNTLQPTALVVPLVQALSFLPNFRLRLISGPIFEKQRPVSEGSVRLIAPLDPLNLTCRTGQPPSRYSTLSLFSLGRPYRLKVSSLGEFCLARRSAAIPAATTV